MSEGDLLAVWLTLKLATCTTAILLLLAPPLAWWRAENVYVRLSHQAAVAAAMNEPRRARKGLMPPHCTMVCSSPASTR